MTFLNYRHSFWPGNRINPQWLKLSMSRTNLNGPKDVRATVYSNDEKSHTKSIWLWSIIMFTLFAQVWLSVRLCEYLGKIW